MESYFTSPRRGYFVDYQGVGHAESPQHVFCGRQVTPGGLCPNCRLPLLRFLAIDTTDERLDLRELQIGELPLLFCWRCNIAQEPFVYRVEIEGWVTLVSYGVSGVESDFPYEDYPVHFPPVAATLIPIPPEQQELLTGLNAGRVSDWEMSVEWPSLARVRHQIGGEPYLLQRDRDRKMTCPSCRSPMPFFASIADDCLDPRGFTGEAAVQVLFYLCRGCRIVQAIQQTD